MKEDLSAELGEKIDQTNKKIDGINAKLNRDVETIQADHDNIWLQINVNNNKMEETAKETTEMVERRLGESVEEIEKQMAILSTEINVEILEVRKEGENTNLKLIQTELYLNQRINEVKQTHDTQFGTITQEQTRMKAAPVSYTHLDVYKRQAIYCHDRLVSSQHLDSVWR